MSVGELLIAGTQVENNMKTRRERRRNTQKILSCVSLTRRAHKPEQTGMPCKMHQRIYTRSLRGTHWPKMSPKGLGRGVAEPLVRLTPPLGLIRPTFLLESPTAFPKTILGCTTSEVYRRIHPWEGYIRRRRAPHYTHHQFVQRHLKM